jgi:hypothetical protein
MDYNNLIRFRRISVIAAAPRAPEHLESRDVTARRHQQRNGKKHDRENKTTRPEVSCVAAQGTAAASSASTVMAGKQDDQPQARGDPAELAFAASRYHLGRSGKLA